MPLTVRPMRREDVTALAALHARVFPAYDSTALGRPYLVALYGVLAAHPAALSLVAVEDGAVVGWLGGVVHYGGYYRALVRACWWRAPALAANALRRRPRLIAKAASFGWWLIRRTAFLRPAAAEAQAGEGEAGTGVTPRRCAYLLVIGVSPSGQRRGVGRALMADFHRRLADAGFGRVRLSTFVDNDAGNAAFARAGYRLESTEGGINRYVKELP